MSHSKQSGFSILELMIALMLGIVVVAGIVQLFVGNSRSYEVINAQARLQENARYSFEFMSQAARDAGYFGCAVVPNRVARQLNGDWSSVPEYNLIEPVAGFDANGNGTYGPNDLATLPRSEGGGNLNVHIAGNGIDRSVLDPASDIVVFRSVRQPVARLAQSLAPGGTPVVSVFAGQPGFQADDVVVVSDCDQAAVFNVTGTAGAGALITLNRATAPGGSLFQNGDQIVGQQGNLIPATLSLISESYEEEATVGVFESTYFFIAPSTQRNNDTRNNPQGEQVNALWRKVGRAAPQELVQGVENMQVLYGIDTINDTRVRVDRYVTADDLDPVNDSVVAVRVRLDINSVDVLFENDDALRRTFSRTLTIRNAGLQLI